MKAHGWIVVCLLLIAAACQPEPLTGSRATPVPFPTMTPGQVLIGQLNPAAQAAGSSPAEAVAIASRATPTPRYDACPVQTGAPDFPELQSLDVPLAEALIRFLEAGGTLAQLRSGLSEWGVLQEGGEVRDIDLTGEGGVEIVIAYTAPGDVGSLLILGCENGRYVARYEMLADGSTPPTIVWVGDVNRDSRTELVLSRRQCESPDLCEFDTQILRWNERQGRFFNLLSGPLRSLALPTVDDIDDDSVTELVVNLDSRGNLTTGPLRTGINIYDWNGAQYVLSIIQLQPPVFRIQIIHEADREFARRNIADAARLYGLALADDDLRYWFNDGPVNVLSYALYRLVLAYTYLEDERLPEVVQRLNEEYPLDEGDTLEDQNVYAALAYTFLNAVQAREDLHTACQAVQRIVEIRPEALELLNRYGRYSPTYTALDLCPF